MPVYRWPVVIGHARVMHRPSADPPYVVKPVNQGSSVGVQIVPEGANELPIC